MNFQAQLDMRVCAFVAIVKTSLVSAHPIIITFFPPTYLCTIYFRHRIALFFSSLQPWIEHALSYDINATNKTLGLEVLTLFTELSISFFMFLKLGPKRVGF